MHQSSHSNNLGSRQSLKLFSLKCYSLNLAVLLGVSAFKRMRRPKYWLALWKSPWTSVQGGLLHNITCVAIVNFSAMGGITHCHSSSSHLLMKLLLWPVIGLPLKKIQRNYIWSVTHAYVVMGVPFDTHVMPCHLQDIYSLHSWVSAEWLFPNNTCLLNKM